MAVGSATANRFFVLAAAHGLRAANEAASTIIQKVLNILELRNVKLGGFPYQISDLSRRLRGYVERSHYFWLPGYFPDLRLSYKKFLW